MGGRGTSGTRNSGNTKQETLKEYTDRFIKESGESRWDMSLERENQLKSQAAMFYVREHSTNLKSMTDEQLDQLFEAAKRSRNREVTAAILEELNERSLQENKSSREITYTSKDIRRRGGRGRR